jgi:hypothetical protein
METRDDEFRRRLLERDAYQCVWTGLESFLCLGIRIIPYSRGSEVRSILFHWEYVSLFLFLRLLFQWLQLIVANRPKHAENARTLHNINDIRNGVLANLHIHHLFDQRRLAILKVCHIYPPALLV